MIKLGIIRPATRTFERVIVPNVRTLQDRLFGTAVDVDHGVIHRTEHGGLGIIVEEYSLFRKNMAYFALGRHVFAGDAIIYGFDAAGHTTPLRVVVEPHWLGGTIGTEAAITAGIVDRPVIKLDGDMIWQWPDPAPWGPTATQQDERPSSRAMPATTKTALERE